MERYRHLLLLGAALVVALIASVIAYRVLQRRAERSEAVAETRLVAVAAVNLSPGMEVRKEMLSVSSFLAKSLPAESVFANPAELEGRVVLSPVQAGEPVFRSRVTGADASGAGVSALVSFGKRAMAVKVDKVIGVSGFIRPQNRVDVLVTLPSPVEKGTTVTKIVLENMLVLAAGTELEKKPGAEKAVPVDVITLEVTPEDAERLTLAAASGRIQLALRNLKDGDTVLTSGSTVTTLLEGFTAAPKQKPAPQPVRRRPAPARTAAPAAPGAAKAAAAAPTSTHQVFVIRGLSESVVNFKEGKE
jgi:pilus assembly protein CpaB